MKKISKLILIISLCLVFYATFCSYALAQTSPAPSPISTGTTTSDYLPEAPTELPKGDINAIIKKVSDLIYNFAQIAFLIVLLVGGVMYITSAGDEGKAKTANKLMLNAVIGIIVVFAAFSIAKYFIEALK